MQKSDGKTVE